MGGRQETRRGFLKQAAVASTGAVGFPSIVPASALGNAGNTAPSNRIVMGCIGMGGQGRGNMGRFMGFKDVQVVAVCDVDTKHRDQGRNAVNEKYGNEDCKAYDDFRELVARKDIDAVSIGTPDHWHALTSIAAANHGKDIYCEKPLANSVGEGRAICEAVKKNGRFLQTGSQERSGGNARRACELVRSGYIGRLHTIRINLPCNDGHHKEVLKRNRQKAPIEPVPDHFDYNFWLGHTPKAPYSPWRTHFWWRFILNYGGGEMTDRGAHVIDIAQLGNGTDYTGPIEFDARGKRSETGLYDAFMDYKFENVFANGVRMIGEQKPPRGLKFEGTDGWIFIHIHGGRLEASSDDLLKMETGKYEVKLGRSPGHHRDFIDAVKERREPVASAEIGHRTASLCHLNNIAMKVGRKLKWDPKREQFVNDAEANALLTPKMRAPWHL
jgi:predicted dehydrogenase